MSQFRVEKRRARSELALSTGVTLWGSFFLAGASATHVPERVSDLLNAEAGFLPFETASVPAETVLVNRAHILSVALLDATTEVQLDPGYSVATGRQVAMVLTNGVTVTGTVRVYRPQGHDRLSDYARAPEAFRYVETAQGTVVVNTAHVVELREITTA